MFYRVVQLNYRVFFLAADKFRPIFDELHPFYYEQKFPGYIHLHSLDQWVLKLS